MRRSLILSTTHKATQLAEVRLYTMDDQQASFFQGACAGLASNGSIPLEKASVYVENMVIGLLSGKMPAEADPSLFIRARMLFPVLTTEMVENLPKAGPPNERVQAIILQFNFKDGGKRTVKLALDADQEEFYNDALLQIMLNNLSTKKEAWFFLNNQIGRLLCGGALPSNPDGLILRMGGLFHALDADGFAKLPDATEEDVRRWSFAT